ncbi:MAG: tetratricopeptide repeat protein [Candidatus Obscuribacterales bacterium]|nr:tetratricopeptide repeat protein [Candidatus Obscuribacterales bacterium]
MPSSSGPERAFLLAFSALLTLNFGLSSCGSRVKTPEGLSTLSTNTQEAPDKQANASNAGAGEKFDPAVDEIISKETLIAWRHALAHDQVPPMDKNELAELRRKDEDESMQMLQNLAKRYPSASFVKTMMGQVKQHFGKKEEAAAFYEEASLQNRHDPILLFKAAEMRRKGGNNERALSYYKELLLLQNDFPGAKLGMARCLLADKKTAAEGMKIIDELLAADPLDKEAAAAKAEFAKN